MSYSSDVKNELMKHYCKSAAGRKAELAALMLFSGDQILWDESGKVYVYGENNFTSAKKAFKIRETEIIQTDPAKLRGNLKNQEEKRAFLRGAFLAAGTMSDPEKEYHLEIITRTEEISSLVLEEMGFFEINARTLKRRERFSVYIKGSEDIALMLNVIEAHNALMKFENTRIEKEINSSVNRRYNCDTANINKTVKASMRQVADIQLIDKRIGLENLDEGLRLTALARLENPDATLEELGDAMSPPVGKSGINHRLRKIKAIADGLRDA